MELYQYDLDEEFKYRVKNEGQVRILVVVDIDALLETYALSSASISCCRHRCTTRNVRFVECLRHTAKTLSSAALGKVHSVKFLLGQRSFVSAICQALGKFFAES
jgi:hypothetical protein